MGISKRVIAVFAVSGLAAIAIVLGFNGSASAIPQSNPSFPTVTCGGTWHWVHNQLPAGTTSGSLTATFQNAGTITVQGTLNPGGATMHYDIVLPAGDTLVSASDTISGGRLLLSTIPQCTTTSPPETSEEPTPEPS